MLLIISPTAERAPRQSGKAAGTTVYKSKALRQFGLIYDLDHMDPISSQETIMDTAQQQITGKYDANLDPSYFLW